MISSIRSGRKNLVLVARRLHLKTDFIDVARRIGHLDPSVSVFVFRDRPYDLLWPTLWMRPTLVFSPNRVKSMKLIRGARYFGPSLPKSEEYRILEAAGLPVPRWALLTPDSTPNLDDFDAYVVSKPDHGGRGAEVKIKRKSRIRYSRPQHARARANPNLLVQQFIYTGPWPVSYRVATLFGEVLYCWRVEADRNRRALADPAAFRGGKATEGGYSIASSGHGCRFTLSYDEEIMNLGRQAAAAAPHIPLLGIDIVREQPSGKLYLIELNSCGETWHLSSSMGLNIQRENQIDMAGQFGGLDLVAKILVDRAHRLAC